MKFKNLALMVLMAATPGQLRGQDTKLESPPGIRLAGFLKERAEIRYLPAHAIWVDAVGQPVRQPQTKSLGDSGWLVSGWVSIAAPPAALSSLQDAGAKLAGKQLKLVEVAPTSFSMRLLGDGKCVWERPDSSDKMSVVPVQAVLATGRHLPRDVLLILSMTWKETLPAQHAKVAIRWDAIERAVRAAIRDDSLTEKDLSTIISTGLREQWIKGQSELVLPAGDLARMLIMTHMLQPAPPIAMDKLGRADNSQHWELTFKLRDSVRIAELSTIFDLSKSITVTRTAIATTQLPTRAP